MFHWFTEYSDLLSMGLVVQRWGITSGSSKMSLGAWCSPESIQFLSEHLNTFAQKPFIRYRDTNEVRAPALLREETNGASPRRKRQWGRREIPQYSRVFGFPLGKNDIFRSFLLVHRNLPRYISRVKSTTAAMRRRKTRGSSNRQPVAEPKRWRRLDF